MTTQLPKYLTKTKMSTHELDSLNIMIVIYYVYVLLLLLLGY